MSPKEIVDHLNEESFHLLYARDDYNKLTHQQVLALMNAAALRGFRLGSAAALSVIESKLLLKSAKNDACFTEAMSRAKQDARPAI